MTNGELLQQLGEIVDGLQSTNRLRANQLGMLMPHVAALVERAENKASLGLVLHALRETQQACNVTQCPWCGHWGQDYAECDQPVGCCHHEYHLMPWQALQNNNESPTRCADCTRLGTACDGSCGRTQDPILRAKLADLLHLLEHASITTPTPSDATLALRVMADLRTMRADG